MWVYLKILKKKEEEITFYAHVGSKLTLRTVIISMVKPDQMAHFKIPLCHILVSLLNKPGLKHNNNFVSIVTALLTKKSEFIARC